MATFTITVNPKTDIAINVSSSTISNCGDIYEILIDVPSGTRWVEFTSTGEGASPTFSEAITIDTTYYIYLDGFKNANESSNTVLSSVRIVIRDTNAQGNILESKTFSRTHTGNFC